MRMVIEPRAGAGGCAEQPLQTQLQMASVISRDRRRTAEGDEPLELIETFIDFRRDVQRRRTEFDLRKAEAVSHPRRLEIALDHIDAVITLIADRNRSGSPRRNDAEVSCRRSVAGDLTCNSSV
jgi:DNA gyrase/topoisomerase IV subunit A